MSDDADRRATAWSEVRGRVLADVAQTLRPELLNRIDGIIVFRSLDQADIRKIVEIQLGHLRRRLADRRITLEITPAAAELLAREGYDPAFGARPLKRTIQRLVQDPLALRLLEGQFAEGDTVVADAERGGIAFRKR